MKAHRSAPNPVRFVKGVVATMTIALVALGAVPFSLASAPTAAAATSTGCAAASPGSTTLSLKVNGFTRTVIVHVPKRSTGTTPLALVLNMHGSGSTALEQEGFTKMNTAANHDGFIVAYPQALIPDGTGFDWNIPGVPLIGGGSVPKSSANDVKFLTSLVAIMESKYCVNPKEVYATGFSGGARMASQLACDDSDLFAAVAPVSGLRRATPCPTSRAVPVISFHGSADPVDPFNGHGQKYWTYSVTTAAKDWSTQDHCRSVAHSAPVSGVKLTTYAQCSNGAQVELYEIVGEGHEWPGGPTLPSSLTGLLGPQSNLVSANGLMWEFFQAHHLP
ncbi:MAG TPA: PHB depolymerase family esterase [Acidimicrobiales bacterium]